MGITENNLTNIHPLEYGLLEFIVSPSNLNAAYLQVKRNKGAGGVDKMEVESLKDYLILHKEELITAIHKGKYRPNPVRRVEIPKENGDKRLLGIPRWAMSPLLSNIMLNELDRELGGNGHKFVRYADDMVILCRN